MEGWIKLYRKFSDWEWFNVSEMVHLFIYLLLNANHEEGNWRGINIKRGQILTGLNSLNEKTGISIRTLRTCLDRLEKTKEIDRQTTNKYSIITICNYESYQGEKLNSDKHSDKQLTSKRQANDKQTTTNNNEENKKNDNNEKKMEFVSEDFLECFKMWLTYKSERKESYKSELSLKTCYSNLLKLSGENFEIAKQIITQSIANNWAGLFPLKTNINGHTIKSNRKDGERTNDYWAKSN